MLRHQTRLTRRPQKHHHAATIATINAVITAVGRQFFAGPLATRDDSASVSAVRATAGTAASPAPACATSPGAFTGITVGGSGLIFPINRYPRFGKVSTYFGASAESPSASRTLFTAAAKPCSKSTNVSPGHSSLKISSRVTTSPRIPQQQRQQLKRLRLQPNPVPRLAQLSRAQVRLKIVKSDSLRQVTRPIDAKRR